MNGLISNNMYRDFAKNTPLNAAMKAVFSEFAQTSDYEFQYEQIHQVRQWLMAQQSVMISVLKSGELSTLPITLIRDRASSSGGTFLRWRYLTNTGAGHVFWKNIVSDENQPLSIRQKLIAAEKDRVQINMQMSVLNFMLRQLKECGQKIEVCKV